MMACLRVGVLDTHGTRRVKERERGYIGTRLRRGTCPHTHTHTLTLPLLSPHISRYKLCDFGSCSTLSAVLESRNDIAVEEERIQRTYGGSTMAYRAPELVDLYSRKRVCEQVDVWALGCLLFKLIFQVRLFLRESSASSCELVRARVSIQGPVEVCGSVGTFGSTRL